MLYRLVYSAWAILPPTVTYLVSSQYEWFFTLSATLMIVAAHTTSTSWFTPKILHVRLYHIIIMVGDLFGILLSSSLRCLLLLHMQSMSASHIYNPQTRHLSFNLGMMIEYHYGTMHKHSIIVEAMEFGLCNGGIGFLLTYLWSKCCTGHYYWCQICRRRRGMYQPIVSVGSWINLETLWKYIYGMSQRQENGCLGVIIVIYQRVAVGESSEKLDLHWIRNSIETK